MQFSQLSANRFLNIPKVLKIIENEQQTAQLLLETLQVQNMQNICIVSGKGGSLKLASDITTHVKLGHQVLHHVIEDNSMAECIKLDIACAHHQIDLIVAIGGGKVIDVCKVAATTRNLSFAIIPTCLSSDCITSPVAVIKNKLGQNQSVAAALATFVFIDLKLIISAPKRLNLAGLGDLISNASALLDWEYAHKINQTPVDDFARLLSSASCDVLFKNPLFDITNLSDLKIVAEGLLISGLSMGFSGDSRPASGAEHLISHALDKLALGQGYHGEQVALATIYINEVRKLLDEPQIDDAIITLIKQCGLPTYPSQLLISRSDFLCAVTLANTMRPDRITILNHPGISPELLNQAFVNSFD